MPKKVDLIFMTGSSSGCTIIESLINKNIVSLKAVITAPDKPKGRGRKIIDSAVSSFCDEKGIKVYQPADVNSNDSIEMIRSFGAEIAIVVDYGKILAKDLIELFPLGAYNIHYSKLPQLRGAAPVRWALIKGFDETGVTLMKINEKLDEGEIVSYKAENILKEDNYGILKSRLNQAGIELLNEFLDKVNNKEEVLLTQQPLQENGFYARKLKKEEFKINWNQTGEKIMNFIRAMNPTPGCYTVFKEKDLRIKVISAEYIDNGNVAPGTVREITEDFFSIGTLKGDLKLIKIQPSGKRVQDAKDFLNGYNISNGDLLL